MSKELEALNEIKNKRIYTDWGDTLYDFNHKAFDVIKQALEQKEQQAKELEELKSKIKLYFYLDDCDFMDNNDYGFEEAMEKANLSKNENDALDNLKLITDSLDSIIEYENKIKQDIKKLVGDEDE